jgi:hypothetical protein
MRAYNNSVVLRNDGVDPLTSAVDLNAALGVNITVRVASTPVAGLGALASIFNIADVAIANPMQTDDKGNYQFKVVNGVYDVVIAEGTADEAIIASEEIIEFDASTSINDLSLPYVFDTAAAYKAFTTAFPVGKIIQLKDRGAEFTVITDAGTGNNANIITSTGFSQSIVLIENEDIRLERWGGGAGGDDTAAIDLAIAYKNTSGLPLVITGGKIFNYVWHSQISTINGDIVGEGGTFNVDFDAAATNNLRWLSIDDGSSITGVNFVYGGAIARRGNVINPSSTSDGATISHNNFSGDFGRMIGAGTIAIMGINTTIEHNRMVSSRDGIGSNIKFSTNYHVANNYIDGMNEGIVCNARGINSGIEGGYVGYNELKGFDEIGIDIIAGNGIVIEYNLISDLGKISAGAASNAFPIRCGQVNYESERCIVRFNKMSDGATAAMTFRAPTSAVGGAWTGDYAFITEGNEIVDFAESAIVDSSICSLHKDNLIKGIGTNGITLSRGSSTVVRGGSIKDCTQYGVIFDDSTTDKVSAVTVRDVEFDDNALGHVKLANRVETGAIENNRFNGTTIANIPALSLEFLNPTASIAFNNNTIGNSTTPFSFNGGTTTQENIDFGDNWDLNGNNKTRLRGLFLGFGGTTSLVITHNLWLEPNFVSATMNELNNCAPTTVDSTAVTITTAAAVGGGKGVYIEAVL